METRIHKVAQQELGADVRWNGQILAVNELMSEHQERGHFISFLVECELVEFERLKVLEKIEKDRIAGELYWFSKCPCNFIPCQKDIYGKYFMER